MNDVLIQWDIVNGVRVLVAASKRNYKVLVGLVFLISPSLSFVLRFRRQTNNPKTKEFATV